MFHLPTLPKIRQFPQACTAAASFKIHLNNPLKWQPCYPYKVQFWRIANSTHDFLHGYRVPVQIKTHLTYILQLIQAAGNMRYRLLIFFLIIWCTFVWILCVCALFIMLDAAMELPLFQKYPPSSKLLEISTQNISIYGVKLKALCMKWRLRD